MSCVLHDVCKADLHAHLQKLYQSSLFTSIGPFLAFWNDCNSTDGGEGKVRAEDVVDTQHSL